MGEQSEADDREDMLAAKDHLDEILEALQPPPGVDAEEYAELLSDLFTETLKRVGLDNLPASDVVAKASADDLLEMLVTGWIPEGSRLGDLLRSGGAA